MWWKGSEFKFQLVNWFSICQPIQLVGLGVRKLLIFNEALLGKWLWPFVAERMLYGRVIEIKDVTSWGGWCTESERGPYSVSLCKFICHLAKAGLNLRILSVLRWDMILEIAFV